MDNKLTIRPTVRPLPYYTVTGSIEHTLLAKSLRNEFVPKISRRLPGHHLAGFRHDMVISIVKKHKKAHPCFLRTDIAKFYPSIRHQDMVVGMQLAYRDLLGLDYVPKEFKRRYLGTVNSWCKSLPLNQGIPLGSPLSTILAPLMLVPLWLEVKRRYRVPFLVYMDDVLVMCRDENQSAEIYEFLADRLTMDYGLSLNSSKTTSGRFSRQSVDFCGWHFSGGYSTICEDKVAAFKERINDLMRTRGSVDTVGFLKRLNRKIDGFGNYYKHGDTGRQFSELDAYLRREVRKWLIREKKAVCQSNEQLHSLGLHSLKLCYDKAHRQSAVKQPVPILPLRTLLSEGGSDFLSEAIDKIVRQMNQIIALQRRQLRILEAVCS